MADYRLEQSGDQLQQILNNAVMQQDFNALSEVVGQNSNDIDAIEEKIPSGASSENKLATEGYVNESVATNSATFRGTYNLVSDLHMAVDASHETIATMLGTAISTADNNDYCFVQVPVSAETPAVIAKIERYKFNGTAWAFEYELNNSGFTAAQWAAINSGITSTDVAKISALDAAVSTILAMIPTGASALNQLATEGFVNSSIATATATFRGTYNLVTDLSLAVDATHAQIGAALLAAVQTADNNDYAFVQVPTSATTPTEIKVTERYKFNGTAWEYEYDLNNSGFTADQWAAINSGITVLLVTKLSGLPDNEALTAMFTAITQVIPSAASSSNKLVDYAQMAAALALKQDNLTFDDVPTLGSNNPVKSNGIKTAIDGLDTRISTNENDIEDLQVHVDALTDQKYVTVTATAQTTSPTDVLPSSGQATDTIYRIGSWDGTQYDPNTYSEYAWTGTAYKFLDKKAVGIDAVPTEGSHNLVESGGIFELLVGTVKFIDGTEIGWNNFKHYVKDIFVFNADLNHNINIAYVWFNRDSRPNNFGLQIAAYEIGGTSEVRKNYDIDGELQANRVYKLTEESGTSAIEVYIRTSDSPTTLSGNFMQSTDYRILPVGYAKLTEAVRQSAIDYANTLFANVNKTIRITSKSQLTDADNAVAGIIYQLNFPASTTAENLPAHLPFDVWGNNNLASLFTYKDGSYGCQYLISTQAIFYRVFAGGQYYDWVMLTKPKEVTVGTGGDYNSLLYALKNTPSYVPIRILADTVIDVEQEYKSNYGNDFWDNYNGYDNDDKFTRGLWLGDNRELYGEENSVLYFPYSGGRGPVLNSFSILAMGKNTYVHDIAIQVNGNCEYHIHDDWFSGNKNFSEMRYERIKFVGLSYSTISIGGGLGGRCRYIIKDCLFFNGTPQTYNVSYHGNGNLTDAYCDIFVSGCYGQGQLVFRKMGPSLLTTECIVSNCSFSKIDCINYDDSDPKDNMRLIKFNCTETIN